MGQLSKQIFFKSPLEIVWKIWSDVEKNPEWVDGVSDSRITSAVKSGPGLCWEEQCLFGANHIQMDHKIMVWEEKKRAVVKASLPMGATIERIVEFRAMGEETEVQLQFSWELGMVSVFLSDEKFSEMLSKSLNATAEKWKFKAENF